MASWQEYESVLESGLADLHSRVHRGAYRGQPSRRVYIPKPGGRQRPLGGAALEDKVVQQAVATILSQIYEEDAGGSKMMSFRDLIGYSPKVRRYSMIPPDQCFMGYQSSSIGELSSCSTRRRALPVAAKFSG
jgi:hypothetical protein